MTKEELFSEIKSALVEFEVDLLKAKAQEAIDQCVDAEEIIRVLSEGMDVVGERYQTGEYFVTSLIIAGETITEALEGREPHLSGGGEAPNGGRSSWRRSPGTSTTSGRTSSRP